jgi:sn-glycerol 3-phosphate transport system ATP-binding protein
MNAGNVSQVGTPQELYDRPANTFAAGFIGTPPMNLLSPEDIRAPSTLAPEGGLTPSDTMFGVRPESLTIGVNDTDFSATARVESLEYEGKVFLVHLVAPSGARFIVAYAGDGAPEEGSEISVGWAAASTHLFSKLDGHRREFSL